jgi:hypothetical protein
MDGSTAEATPGASRTPPFKDVELPREAGRKGGIASGISRRQRAHRQLERIVMQSRNGAAAVARLREMEARDRAEERRRQAEERQRERDVEGLEQRAEKARMDAIGWDRYGERLVDQLHHWEAERDELETRVEKLRQLEAELRRSIASGGGGGGHGVR